MRIDIDARIHHALQHGCRQFFSRFTKDQSALFIDHILQPEFFRPACANSFSDLILTFRRAEKLFDDIGVGGIAKRADKCRRQNFAAAFFAVDVDMDQIVCIKSPFQPASTIRNDAEGIDDVAA